MSTALLIALLAKSSVVAGLGLGLSHLVARRAEDRVDVLRATVCILLALPVLMTFGPALSLALLPAAPAVAQPAALWVGDLTPVEGVTVSGELFLPSLGQTLALVWTLGALIVGGRFAAGVWTLSRWTEAGRPVKGEVWTRALETVAPHARPTLKSSERITSPLSWGLPPGAVLLDPATLNRPQTAAAVMAHEMAHIRRRDWLFLVLSRMVLALFWFNPLVWVLHRSLIERSEEAADAVAVGQVDRHDYARALIGLAAAPGSPNAPMAATAMAGDGRSLKRRIATLMTDKTPARRPTVILTAVAALAAVATPIAALEISARAPKATPAVLGLASPAAAAAEVAPFIPGSSQTPAAQAAEARSGGFNLAAFGFAPPAPPAPPAPSHVSAPPAPPAPPTPMVGLIAPPAPPAPPVPPTYAGPQTIIYNGRNWEDLTPEERQQVEEARQAAEEARRAADAHRRVADRIRLQADRERGQADVLRQQADVARLAADRARIAGEQARRVGLAQAAEASRSADAARAQARVARAEAVRARADARVHMRSGAVQMRQGAEDMRRESRRLNDPEYRARQIRENAERGHTVTDAELRALAPRLLRQADELEQRANELAARAEEA